MCPSQQKENQKKLPTLYLHYKVGRFFRRLILLLLLKPFVIAGQKLKRNRVTDNPDLVSQ